MNICIKNTESSPIVTVSTVPSKSKSVTKTKAGNQSVSSSGIDCGEHGESVDGGVSCRCDSGWVSDPNQNIFDFKWCTVPYSPPAYVCPIHNSYSYFF